MPPLFSLLEIDNGAGRTTRQCRMAARRNSRVWIERGYNDPICGYIEFVDRHHIRLGDYQEWHRRPGHGQSTTIFRDDISEVYIHTRELREIREGLAAGDARWRARQDRLAELAYLQERGILARGSRPLVLRPRRR